MCTYNGEKYIREQLDSILNQSYPIYEIIIQDDRSTDNTWPILNEYRNKYDFIKCFRNENNVGVNHNFKTAFLKATGDFIAPSDQDDIWFPYKIEHLVNSIGNRLCAFSRSQILYADGETGKSVFPLWKNIEQCIWKGCIGGHTCMFSKDILDEIKYSLECKITFDFVITLIVYARKSYIYVDEELQIWRRHENAITKNIMYHHNENERTNIMPTSKIEKLYFVFKSLLQNKKSDGIGRYFQGVSKLLFYIEGENSKMGKLAVLLAKQTLCSYFKAGLLCVRYKGRMFLYNKGRLSVKEKLARYSFAFRYPFFYWYDNHLEPYL